MENKILIIDGAYLSHKTLGTVNMGDKVNNLQSPNDLHNFEVSLNQTLINIYSKFNEYGFTNMIIAVDNKENWRKQIEPIRPYYIEMDDKITPLTYKGQRKSVKDKSDINYDNFYLVTNKFFESLKANFNVIDIDGLEGDDVILLLAREFKDTNLFGIVYCTDGDLFQIVNNNCILFRNIKSKTCPEGEFGITSKIYSDAFEGTKETEFMPSNGDRTYFRNLFSMSPYYSASSINRSINEGIKLAIPYKIALLKSICGDKKDNIFSVLSWKSKTGTTQYKLTEKIIEKALKSSGHFLTESTCKQILSDKKILKSFIRKLIIQQKQEHVDFEEVMKHLVHNLRLIILSVNNLPKESVNLFSNQWEHLSKQLNLVLTPDTLKSKLTVNKKDDATDIMEQSLPDGL